MEEVPLRAREHGYVRSIYGRIRPLQGINDRNANIRKAAEREAINMPIQGTASDIVKIAMLKVDEEFKREGIEAKLLMQVHDELLVEASAGRRRARSGDSQARNGIGGNSGCAFDC